MSSAVVGRVVDQLRNFGETRRGWLGVRIQNVDPDVAEAMGLKEAKGALITDVPDGPAAKAGLKSGDVVLKFGGEPIEDTRELVKIVADSEVGKSVDVVIFRSGKEMTLPVEVGLLEDDTTLASASPGDGKPDAPAPSTESVLGMTLSPLTDEMRQSAGLDKDARGLLVTAIEDGSDAFSKGLREGDLIVEVGQEPVASPDDMQKRVDAAEAAGRNSILLLVRRDGQPRFVALNLSN